MTTSLPASSPEQNGRFAMAPYQHGARFERRAARRNPTEPVIWGVILTFVPLFWLTTVAWFARVVF